MTNILVDRKKTQFIYSFNAEQLRVIIFSQEKKKKSADDTLLCLLNQAIKNKTAFCHP